METVSLIRDESKDLDSGFFTTEGYHTFRFDKTLVDNFSYKLIVSIRINTKINNKNFTYLCIRYF